jgi:hypothetical protein
MHSRPLILSLCLYVHFHFCSAQTGFSTLPSHTPTPYTVSQPDSVYRFPSFEYGRVTFATSFSPHDQLRFNYNLFTGQMDMINSKGDTVQIKQIKELKFISIADHLFFHSYNVGYLEILHQSTVSLGVLNLLIDAYRANGSHAYLQRTKGTKSDLYFKNQASYYFIETDNKPHKATPSSIRNLFYDHKKAVKSYLNENKIDFEREDDLIKLLTFCNQLDQKNSK